MYRDVNGGVHKFVFEYSEHYLLDPRAQSSETERKRGFGQNVCLCFVICFFLLPLRRVRIEDVVIFRRKCLLLNGFFDLRK